jgi:hypothetical protein
MALKLMEFQKQQSSRYKYPAISLYAKMKRLVLNQEAQKKLRELADGEDVNYVQFFQDEKHPDTLYIKPANADDVQARKLLKSSKSGRFLNGGPVLPKLGWGDIDKGLTFRVLEDKKNPGMICIDRNETV